MIRRLVLENYMSHSHTVIELAEGLTVLVGENNCGKSAVVSALQTLCFNWRGDYMVRHGVEETSVAVETSDGHVIEWRRRGPTVSYRIDGENIHRPHHLKGGVPERLHEILKLPKVETEARDEFDIHFGEQKSPIFLLNQPGSKAALFFASSSDAADLMEMQRRHKLHVRDARREEENLSSEIERLKGLLAALDPLEELAARAKALEKEYDEVRELGAETASLEGALRDIRGQELDLRRQEALSGALASLATPPDFHETGPIEEVCRDLQAEIARAAGLRARREKLSALEAPPEIQDTRALEGHLAEMERTEADFRSRGAEAGLLKTLAPPAEQADTGPVEELVKSLREALDGCREQARLLAGIEKALAAAREDVEGWVSEHEVCPTCGQTLDADHLLSTEH